MGQTSQQLINKIISLQNKAMRIIHFQLPFAQPNLLNFLPNKLVDQIKILNCIFVWEQQSSKLPLTFKNLFTLTKETHNHNLRYVELVAYSSRQRHDRICHVSKYLRLMAFFASAEILLAFTMAN